MLKTEHYHIFRPTVKQKVLQREGLHNNTVKSAQVFTLLYNYWENTDVPDHSFKSVTAMIVYFSSSCHSYLKRLYNKRYIRRLFLSFSDVTI